MENVTLDRAVEVVRALSPDQQQLIDLLKADLTPSSAATVEPERRFAEYLLAKGIITHIPARSQQGHLADDYPRHPPVIVQGEAVSETVIRERR